MHGSKCVFYIIFSHCVEVAGVAEDAFSHVSPPKLLLMYLLLMELI